MPSDLDFVGWVVLSLVSFAIYGYKEDVMVMCCLISNASGILLGIDTEVSWYSLFLGIGN